MSGYPPARTISGAQVGDMVSTGPAAASVHNLHSQPQPVASSSRNPQLGPHPFFRYPTPTAEQIEEELPPYWETENVPLGQLLDGLTRKAYNDMRILVEKTLPPLPAHQRPKHIIEYAKVTRQAVLKYLAVLRWKTTVDLATSAASQANGAPPAGPTPSFPTPHSNGESNNTSPPAYPTTGKARPGDVATVDGARGKVTDARRIQQFLEHQNAQHEVAITHIQHITTSVNTLRERNADLLTALALQSAGTYTRLPTSLTDFFTPQPSLTPTSIMNTVQRLNDQIRYRLKCVDYVPPELVIEKVEDGRVHVRGGGPNGWLAQLSVVGFEEDSRWWLTGVEWGWRVDGTRQAKEFTPEERQQILDVANLEVLVPRPLPDNLKPNVDQVTIDAPLVRIHNFLQHLSLTYQLEVLFSQAVALIQSRWRGNLLVDVDRVKKELRIRYWSRPRAAQPAAAGPNQANVGRRPQPNIGRTGSTPVGGTLMLSIGESKHPISEAEQVLREVVTAGNVPTDRVLRLEIGMKWEVGEFGVGGGLRVNDLMDVSPLKLNPTALSAKALLTSATTEHATILARATLTPLLSNPRLIMDPLNPPRFAESDSALRPLSLIIPVPSQHGEGQFVVAVSATSGLIEIEDTNAKDNGQGLENNRTVRTKMASAAVNEQKGRLAEDVYRLMLSVIMEDVEDNLRQLGLQPIRRLALRTNDLAKTDLGPASTLFVPLPVSDSHYFVCKVTPDGLAYELVKILRVPMVAGGGLKLAIGDRIPIDLNQIVERRNNKSVKRALDGDDVAGLTAKLANASITSTCRFQFNPKDFKDMFFYCNALVAQTMVEQQLKDRTIPYTIHFPDDSDFPTPRSRSALAGMVPHLCVNASDLFKDGRAAEVASPKVFLVINDWWKGSKCSVETIVRLRHRPSVTSTNDPASTPTSTTSARADGIKFDPVTSTVRFRAPKIAQCVPDFLEQWERLSKVIVVAGEVNRLNRSEQFRDIRLISFDLCTATLQYAHGYQVAITYTPTSDSYHASFFRTQPTSTPAPPTVTGATDKEEENPHQLIAHLLSHYLNELTTQPQPAKDGSNGKQFIQLLRATLPLLLEAEALRTASHGHFPALVVRSVTEYRLVWDNEGTVRYALEIALTADAKSFLISDASKPKGDVPLDLSCGPLTAIPNLERVVLKGFQAARAAKAATPGSVSTPAAAMTPAVTASRQAVSSGHPSMPPALRLDNGHSILCATAVVQDVLRAMSAELETAVASASL